MLRERVGRQEAEDDDEEEAVEEQEEGQRPQSDMGGRRACGDGLRARTSAVRSCNSIDDVWDAWNI